VTNAITKSLLVFQCQNRSQFQSKQKLITVHPNKKNNITETAFGVRFGVKSKLQLASNANICTVC